PGYRQYRRFHRDQRERHGRVFESIGYALAALTKRDPPRVLGIPAGIAEGGDYFRSERLQPSPQGLATYKDLIPMRKLFPTFLFAILASASVAVSAAESKPVAIKPAATQQVASGKINLNTADAATLERELKGIGAGKAQAIVAYRDAHGPFASVDELLEVKGIGAATLEKNLDKLSLQ